MSVKGLRVSVPLGMDAALEGLARAVLREQPSDIYMFAADHFQSLLRKREATAHNAGISPSSTQESNSKQPVSEDGTRPIQEDRSIGEEPESNDTSYGVEATAVRTLAATTGTVAILGTTAKSGDKKDEASSEATTPVLVPTIPEEQEELSSGVEQVVVHEEENGDRKSTEKSSEPASANSRPVSNHLEENDEKESVVKEPELPQPSLSNDDKDNSQSASSGGDKAPPPESDNSQVTSPDVKSPVLPLEEIKPKNAEENIQENVVSESTKDKEEDISKSISSERLKTNSLSNTTLSSDSIAEIENASVKQSPSVEKVIESFDSSSTVEFVDIATKDSPQGEGPQDDNATNTARSISSDLSNKANLPVDGEKTPDVTSPVEPEEKCNSEELPAPPQLDAADTLESQVSNATSPSKLGTGEAQEDITAKEEIDMSNSSQDNLQNEEPSLNSEITSNTFNSIQSVLKNGEAKDDNSDSAVENDSPNASDEVKAETGSPFSTDNNSSLNDNGDAASPVKTCTSSPAPDITEGQKEEVKIETTPSVDSDKSKDTPKLTNGTDSRNDTPVEKEPAPESVSKTVVNDVENSTKSTEPKFQESGVNGEISDDVFGSPIDLSDEKVVAAATTIQATYRGFQTRQNLKENEKSETFENPPVVEPAENLVQKTIELVKEIPLNSASESLESTNKQDSLILDDVDDKMIVAATTIQANFRGYQTRQTLQNRDSALPTSEDTNQSSERKTPTALTPELIESVKEEVDDICKEAEIIAAERAESVEGMIAGVHQVVVEAKESTLPSVSESVQAMRGSVTPPSVSDVGPEDGDNFDGKEEVFDLLPTDEKTIQAATTIQASFRGFQTRKNLQDNQEQPDSMPDYPPPGEEDLMASLDDLPPPDFEALESSYSEDAPTEPLAPPPPPDSVIFNEEDEDELMSLQQLQRPPECDELPEHRLTVDTDSSESSLSSAATKIQAGVRGYLTRKQMQAPGDATSTSTNVPDSDQSLSVSREDDGVRSAISTEEESEVCRHVASPNSDTLMEMDVPRASRSATKRMSLGNNAAELPPARQRAPLRSAVSVQGPPTVSDDDVWDTLKGELSDAATRIQSNFRGYRARKQLQREDAMQVTSSSSQATGSSGSPAGGDVGRVSGASESREGEDVEQTTRSSGEYHDIIALTPPTLQSEGGGADAVAAAVAGEPADDADLEMVKRRAEDDAKEAAAATKIQATFRGFKTRQELKDIDQAAAKIQAGYRGYKVRKEMKDGRSRRSSNPEQGETPQRIQQSGSVEESAATKIQAGVRGFLVRRKYQKEQDAATKIQAGFRGYHSRKQATNQ